VLLVPSSGVTRRFFCGTKGCAHNNDGTCISPCILIDEKDAKCATYKPAKKKNISHDDLLTETSKEFFADRNTIRCGKISCVHNAKGKCKAEKISLDQAGDATVCQSLWQI